MGGFGPLKDEFGNGETVNVNIVGGTLTGSDGAILDGVSSSIKATVLDYSNSNPLAVRLTDTNGDYIGAGAGTQYTEDAVAAADPVGTVPILVRKDTPSATVTNDGDNIAQRGTDYGAAYVTLLDTGGNPVSVGGGTQYTEGATDASITGTAAFMEGAADTLVPLQGTATDGLLVNLGANNDVSVTSSALPTGAATSAKQDTIIGHVDGIEGLLTTIDADTGNISTKIDTLAGAVSGTEMQVDIVTMPAVDTELTTADLDTGAGTDTRAVVGLVGSASGGGQLIPGSATDGLLVNLGANNDVTVTGSVTANAGTNLNTSLLALESGGNLAQVATLVDVKANADDPSSTTTDGMKVLFVRQDTPANTSGLDGDYELPKMSNGRVWTSTTVTGTVAVTDNSGSLTVDAPVGTPVFVRLSDGAAAISTLPVSLASVPSHAVTNAGTFAVQESGAALTALQLIDDGVATVASAITTKGMAAVGTDGTNARILKTDTSGELQVDIVGALPAGTNAIGKLAANSGVDIGDVDVTSVVPGTTSTSLGKAEDAGHTTGDTGVYVLGVRNDTPNTALTNTDADYASITTDRVGGVRTALYETDFAVLGTNHVKKYYTNAGAVTDGIVWSPAAGKRWYVTDIFINVSAAATVTLEDDLVAGDSPVWKAELAANSGWSHHFGTPLFSGEDAADLLVTTTAGNVYITVTGYEV